jgi:hypothetical protein
LLRSVADYTAFSIVLFLCYSNWSKIWVIIVLGKSKQMIV